MTDTRPLFRSEVAERFRNLRRDAFLTQRMLADVVGLYQPTISRIETCRVMLWPSTWRKFPLVEDKFQQGLIDPHQDWTDWMKFR
jgi:predicted transcriptional regulator